MRDRENDIRDSGDKVRDSREKGAGCTRDRDLAFQIQFKWTKESAKIYHHFDLTPLASKKTIFS